MDRVAVLRANSRSESDFFSMDVMPKKAPPKEALPTHITPNQAPLERANSAPGRLEGRVTKENAGTESTFHDTFAKES